MGSRCSILAVADSVPQLAFKGDWSADFSASRSVAEKLTKGPVEYLGEKPLDSALMPDVGTIYVGSASGIDLVTWSDLRSAEPSSMTSWVAQMAPGRDAFLVLMDSTVDWSAFAVWRKGVLVRSVSVSYDDSVIENIGEPMLFERDLWNGDFQKQVPAGYPLQFQTSTLGNEALRNFFGFVLEGRWDPEAPDPEEIVLYGFSLPDAEQRQAEVASHAGRMTHR